MPHTCTSLDLAVFCLKNTTKKISDSAIYSHVFSKLAKPLNTQCTAWGWSQRPQSTHTSVMKNVCIIMGTDSIYTCSQALHHGSAGILFVFVSGTGDTICAKFTITAHLIPPSIKSCKHVVTHSSRLQGRIQLMPVASHDAWEYHSRFLNAKKNMHRCPENYRVWLTNYWTLSLFIVHAAMELFSRGLSMIDFKTENILVFKDGEKVTYKLCDIESIAAVGAKIGPSRRCTFHSTAICLKNKDMDVHTTLFSLCCTGIDMANNFLNHHDRIDLDPAIVAPKSIELSFKNPIVRRCCCSSNKLLEPWAHILSSLCCKQNKWMASSADLVRARALLHRSHDMITERLNSLRPSTRHKRRLEEHPPPAGSGRPLKAARV